MIDAVLFDIGNVLVRFDFTLAIERIAARSARPAGEIRELLAPLVHSMECGARTTEAFLADARAATGFRGTPGEFIAAYTSIFDLNEPMAAVVDALSAHRPVYLLSNTSALHLDYLRTEFEIFQKFRGGVFSHQARCLKPDPEIFRQAIAACGLTPARTLFVDDAAANTAAAAQLGLQTCTYDWRDHAAFVNFLRACGLC